ncbi:hypothetical protein NKH18_34880 [Streptomyces sp. M10(2022)]
MMRGTVRNLLTTLSGEMLDPYSAAMSNAVLDALFERLAPRGKAGLERVYGAYPGAAGQPHHGLGILAADFRAGGEARELAEGFLFRALREDLEAAYASTSGWLRRVGRPGCCWTTRSRLSESCCCAPCSPTVGVGSGTA